MTNPEKTRFEEWAIGEVTALLEDLEQDCLERCGERHRECNHIKSGSRCVNGSALRILGIMLKHFKDGGANNKGGGSHVPSPRETVQ